MREEENRNTATHIWCQQWKKQENENDREPATRIRNQSSKWEIEATDVEECLLMSGNQNSSKNRWMHLEIAREEDKIQEKELDFMEDLLID